MKYAAIVREQVNNAVRVINNILLFKDLNAYNQ